MKNRQLNVRIDCVSYNLLETIVEEKGIRQSEVIRKALFDYAEKELGQIKVQEVVYQAFRGSK